MSVLFPGLLYPLVTKLWISDYLITVPPQKTELIQISLQVRRLRPIKFKDLFHDCRAPDPWSQVVGIQADRGTSWKRGGLWKHTNNSTINIFVVSHLDSALPEERAKKTQQNQETLKWSHCLIRNGHQNVLYGQQRRTAPWLSGQHFVADALGADQVSYRIGAV